MLEPISEMFSVSIAELLSGNTIQNTNAAGNVLRSKFYVCPVCGNVVHSMGETAISCHGIMLPLLESEAADEKHKISYEGYKENLLLLQLGRLVWYIY